jgi:hypothetical protein
MKFTSIEDFKKATLGEEAYGKLVTEQVEVNEALKYKPVLDIVLKDFDKFERLVNDSVLDRVFRIEDYKDRKVPEKDLDTIKQALYKLMDEIIDIWDQTANESNESLKAVLEEKSIANLVKYFSTTWSKDKNLIQAIKGDKDLTTKYDKYLSYSDEDWKKLSDEELKTLWDAWAKDAPK